MSCTWWGRARNRVLMWCGGAGDGMETRCPLGRFAKGHLRDRGSMKNPWTVKYMGEIRSDAPRRLWSVLRGVPVDCSGGKNTPIKKGPHRRGHRGGGRGLPEVAVAATGESAEATDRCVAIEFVGPLANPRVLAVPPQGIQDVTNVVYIGFFCVHNPTDITSIRHLFLWGSGNHDHTEVVLCRGTTMHGSLRSGTWCTCHMGNPMPVHL